MLCGVYASSTGFYILFALGSKHGGGMKALRMKCEKDRVETGIKWGVTR
jgi:hypothetical protein